VLEAGCSRQKSAEEQNHQKEEGYISLKRDEGTTRDSQAMTMGNPCNLRQGKAVHKKRSDKLEDDATLKEIRW